jgi:hypothetical protein
MEPELTIEQSFLINIGKTKMITKKLPKKAKLANIIKRRNKFRLSMYKAASETSAMTRTEMITILPWLGSEKP